MATGYVRQKVYDKVLDTFAYFILLKVSKAKTNQIGIDLK